MKIKTLSLTDFRAFPDPAPATFDLGGKNLLVCGENGSGKSSLFYALRGFFSSGQPSGLMQWRNSFSELGIGGVKVEVVFDDDTPAVWQVGAGALQMYGQPSVQGPTAVSQHPGFSSPVNSKVIEATKFSAMLDYRSLLNTNYKHGDGDINLFQLAVDGFLAGCRDLATNKTIHELWQAVCVERCNEFNNVMHKALGLLLVEAQASLLRLA